METVAGQNIDRLSTCGPMSPHRLAYICFQATRQGQASYAHVHEIIGGLHRNNCAVKLYEPRYAGTTKKVGLLERLREFCLLQLRAAFRMGDTDCIYCRYHFAALPLLLFARMRHVPVVVEVNGTPADAFIAYSWLRRLSWLVEAATRSCLRLADEIITVTPELAAWAEEETGNVPVSVVPNGANAELFRPGAAKTTTPRTPYVIFVGALARWQGVDTILRAASSSNWPEGVRVVIVGEGPLAKDAIAAAQANPHIVYLGARPYREIPELIAGGIGALVPAKNGAGGVVRTKGLSPLKLYEAAACGVPVIVSDLPGLADFVRFNSCGLVIPEGDESALANAVRVVARDGEARRTMGLRARAAIVSGHTWAQRAEETARIIDRVIQGRTR